MKPYSFLNFVLRFKLFWFGIAVVPDKILKQSHGNIVLASRLKSKTVQVQYDVTTDVNPSIERVTLKTDESIPGWFKKLYRKVVPYKWHTFTKK